MKTRPAADTIIHPSNFDVQHPVRTQRIMTVTLDDCVGLSFSEHHNNVLNKQHEHSHIEAETQLEKAGAFRTKKSRVYAIVEFDRSQSIVYALAKPLKDPLLLGDFEWLARQSIRFDVLYGEQILIYVYVSVTLPGQDCGRMNDICLGITRITPNFQIPLQRECLHLQHGTGSINVTIQILDCPAQAPRLEDFETLSPMGNKRRGKVDQVRKRNTRQVYAMKAVQKYDLVAHAQVIDSFETAKLSVAFEVKNPFLVPVKFVLQSSELLYLVSPFVYGGELLKVLKQQRVDTDTIKLYTAEIICAFGTLHALGITSGDLQSQNILLDFSGHISICDFGLWVGMKGNFKSYKGQPSVAPEVRLGNAPTAAADWWTLGILLAEMLTGLPPTWSQQDLNSNLDLFYFPSTDSVDPVARDIVIRLLDRDPKLRLGVTGIADLKAHPFFNDLDWHKVLYKDYEPILKPNDAHLHYEASGCEFPASNVQVSAEEIEATRKQIANSVYTASSKKDQPPASS